MSPVASFCATELKTEQFVSAGDYSDIAEQQAVKQTVCGRPAVNACVSVPAGTTVRYFVVVNGSVTSEYSRNQYIGFMNGYADQNGPFKLDEVSGPGNELTMHFRGQGGRMLDIEFGQTGNTWVMQQLRVG